MCVHGVSLCMSRCFGAEMDVAAACVCVCAWVFVRSFTGSHGQRVFSPHYNATAPPFEIARQKCCLTFSPPLISSSISQAGPATLILPLYLKEFILLHASILLIALNAKVTMYERSLLCTLSTSLSIKYDWFMIIIQRCVSLLFLPSLTHLNKV